MAIVTRLIAQKMEVRRDGAVDVTGGTMPDVGD
jgi:hypothetical protein